MRFTSVGHAIQFVEKHYPNFQMNNHRVRVDYCNKEGAREDKNEWKCSEVKEKKKFSSTLVAIHTLKDEKWSGKRYEIS